MLKLLSFKISFHLKQSTLLAILILGLSSTKAVGQSRVYRTESGGSWHDVSKWKYQLTNDTTWHNVNVPTDLPDENATQIIIDHAMSINVPVQADDIVINSGLYVYSDLTIPNAGGFGIQMNTGVLEVDGGSLHLNDNVIEGNGEFVLWAGSTLAIGSPEGIDADKITGNIQASGSSYLDAGATYIYNGNSPQVTGTGLPLNAHIEIKNPAGVTLSQPTKAASVTLTAGKLITESTKLLTLNNTSPIAAANSFVDGPLVIKADGSRLLKFPVGKGSNSRMVELQITNPSNNDVNTYTVEQFESEYSHVATQLPNSVSHISKLRYFTLQKSGTATVDAKIKLNYGANDGVADLSELTIVTFQNGVTEDLVVTERGDGFIAANISSLAGSYDFMLANKTGGNNPLPVELLSFTAKGRENATVLTWETASEQNSNHFEIQRSQNAQTYETLGTIQAAGQSQSLKHYTFEDKNPITGITYYRLKQVDTDGTVAYSKIEQVNRETGNLEMQLYPNPTSGKLYIATSNPISKVIIFNTLGQEVVADQTENNTGATLDLTHLSAGVYQLVIESGSTRETRKFVKTGL